MLLSFRQTSLGDLLVTLDNYCVVCKPHVENDYTVAEELHERLQAEGNAHSVLWVRLLQMPVR